MLHNRENRVLTETAQWLRENQHSTPVYLLDLEVVEARYRELAEHLPDADIHYAIKANSDFNLLQFMNRLGCKFEAVSLGEVLLARQAGISAEDIVFTCAGVPETELRKVYEAGVTINADSIAQLEHLAAFGAKEVSLRLNLDVSAGHHAKVRTGGERSKFGVHRSMLGLARTRADQLGMKIIGLHQHIGSDYTEPEHCLKAMGALFTAAREFADLRFLDFGGGIGVPNRSGAEGLDIAELGRQVTAGFRRFKAEYGNPELQCKFEPGRRLVAEAGALIVGVTERKENPERTFILTDSGFGHFARVILYDSYHEIVAVGKPDSPTETVTITGRVCESGDIFAENRSLPKVEAGDYLAILTAGAYGDAMATDRYNMLPLPAKVMRLPDGAFSISQPAETSEERADRFVSTHQHLPLD